MSERDGTPLFAVLILMLLVSGTLMAVARVRADEERDARIALCRMVLSTASASDSLRLYRLQPKCMP